MADECVVCGEAEEGKPLYKKLGSGEFNVEVITALKALQMLTIPEAAKNNSYICWDCDELIVEQYDRYLQEQKQKAPSQKQTKKKKKSDRDKLKLTISKNTEWESSWEIDKSQSNKKSSKKSSKAEKLALSTSQSNSLSKTKQLEKQRATNAYHFSHCLMCDCTFENERRTYQRFSLKNRINDEMDIAQVMEVLGLARHIAPDMKARRYVCNPCFVIIRRSYKDKLMKETTKEATAQSQPSAQDPACPQASIHRATTEEHAAEIAKLLPPGLAECYKIMTQNPVKKKAEVSDKPQGDFVEESSSPGEWDEHDGDGEEEGEGPLIVSHDEYGNCFIDVDEKRTKNDRSSNLEEQEQLALPHPSQRKKNVLLPKRMHKHLFLSSDNTPGELTDTSSAETENVDVETEEEVDVDTVPPSINLPQESQGKMCNICGITISHKPSSWWHTLTSPLATFDTITVSTALKLLETSLISTPPDVTGDQSVCLPCYTKVSAGFKSQVVQKIARQRNIDASEVNLSLVNVRMLPKDALKSVKSPSVARTTTEATMAPESPSETPSMASSSEETGEGEKENVDIEKSVQKRKKDENCNSEKRRKLPRRDVKSDTGKGVTLDRRGNKGPRDKFGRFLKTSLQNEPQAAALTTHINQKDKTSVTPAITQEGETIQPLDSKESKPLVVLKDLKFVLPKEAFSGKTVSSHKIESIMEPPSLSNQMSVPLTGQDTNASPLQLVFSALSIYHPPVDDPEIELAMSTSELSAVPKVCGRCMVCGCVFTVPQSAWHSVEDNVRPPSILVPVRWVCVSLAICLPQVSVEEARQGRVCEKCFKLLGEQFELFIKKKVGESCGLEADAVDLSEYLFTFNPTTMNLEADPKQQSYIHEFEDVGQLLQRIQPLVEQFSLDEMVGEGGRQPLQEKHFCVWLLLLLNELRLQVGAAVSDLAQWLVSLMPSDMYESGLRPCPNNLESFLLNITMCFRKLTQEMLEGPIPGWVFVAENTFPVQETDKESTTMATKNNSKNPCWEDYLQYVNFDALVGGRAQPVSPECFTRGVVYAVWRTSQLLGEGDLQLMDWLRQISPLPLSKEQMENLLTMIGTLHNHLEEHPEDIRELQHQLTLQQLANDQSSLLSLSSLETIPHSSVGLPTNRSCTATKQNSSAHDASDSREETKSFGKTLVSKRRRGVMLNSHSHKKQKLSPGVSSANIIEEDSDSSQDSSGSTGTNNTTSPSEEMDVVSRSFGHAASSDETAIVTPEEAVNTVKFAKEKLTTTESSADNMSISILSEKTTNTAESAGDAVASPKLSEINVEARKVVENPGYVCNPIRETASLVSQSARETVTNKEPSDETPATTEPREGMAESSEVFPLTNDLVDGAASLSESAGKITEENSKHEETSPLSDPLKEKIIISDPAEETVVKETTTTSECDVLTATREPEVETAIKGPSLETATVSNLAVKTVALSPYPSEETMDTSMTAQETTTKHVDTEEITATSLPAEETTATSLGEETMVTGVPEGDTATMPLLTKEIEATSVPVESTATSLPARETAVTHVLAKEATPISKSAEEIESTCVPAEETPATLESAEETAPISKSSEETESTCVPAEESSATLEPAKETTPVSKSTEETASTYVPAEETSATLESTEETTPVPKSAEETESTCVPAEEMSATLEPAEETVSISKSAEETVSISKSAEETESTCVSAEETSATLESAEETTATCKPTEETTVSSTLTEGETSSTDSTAKVTSARGPVKTASSVEAEESSGFSETSRFSDITDNPHREREAVTEEASQTLELVEEEVTNTQTKFSAQHSEGSNTFESSDKIPLSVETKRDERVTFEHPEGIDNTATLLRDTSTSGCSKDSSELSKDAKVTVQTPPVSRSSGQVITPTVTTEVSEKVVTTPGLCMDPNASSELNKNTEISNKDSLAILGQVGQDINARSLSKVVVPTVSKETAPTTTTAATADKKHGTITATTTMPLASCSPPIKLSQAQGIVSNSRVTTAVPDPAATKVATTSSSRENITISGHQNVVCTEATLTSPPHSHTFSKATQGCLIKVSQNESLSEKTSHEPVGSELQASAKEKSLGDCQKAADLQSITKKSDSQAHIKLKNEDCGSNPEERTVIFVSKDQKPSSSSSTLSVHQKGDISHKVFSHDKEEPLPGPEKLTKTEASKKSLQSSKNKVTLISKKKALPEAPVLDTRSSLHRSERVCISVSTTNQGASNLQVKNEHVLGSNKIRVLQSSDSHKERLRTEKGKVKGSHSSTPLVRINEGGGEDNNNSENSSMHHSRASSKKLARNPDSVHMRDSHSTQNEKCKLEEKQVKSKVLLVKRKQPEVSDTRHKSTPSSEVCVLFDKKPKSIENQCEKERVGSSKKSVAKSHRKAETKINVELGESVQKTRHEKMPVILSAEEKVQTRKSKVVSPTVKADKSYTGRTSGSQGAALRTSRGPAEKKQKLSFEELMNYDVRGIEYS